MSDISLPHVLLRKWSQNKNSYVPNEKKNPVKNGTLDQVTSEKIIVFSSLLSVVVTTVFHGYSLKTPETTSIPSTDSEKIKKQIQSLPSIVNMPSGEKMEVTEVETFLCKRIDNAMKEFKPLQEKRAKDTPISARLSNLCQDFRGNSEKLKNMIIKEMTGPEFDSLYYLYYLNNVISMWQKLLLEGHYMKMRRLNESLKTTIAEARKEIDSHSQRGEETQQQSQKDIKLSRWSSHSVDSEKIHGFEDKIMILERLLTTETDSFKAIGILGMAGAGKTALCQLAFNNQKVKEHDFFPRIWVCLSKQASDPQDEKEYRKEVVKRMLLSLGLELTDKQVQDFDLRILLMALRQELKGKKYLIVLDDLWNFNVKKFCSLLAEDRDEDGRDGHVQLVNGLPKEHGAVVIVNSRYEDITKTVVGEKNVLRLLPLEDKESCWKVFTDAAENGGEQSDMENMNDKIIRKCAGLPLTAKMMGRVYASLQNKGEDIQKKTKATNQEKEE